ncbi:unnamed protein product [Triticum turgidum subsp. durum]|uniref:CCR4-NOT transcription complex subunit 11 n=1 Tax=Triticum turgidum subsp. durum TaxID=4567 RepID=A0A9R0X324_TRITD|nr:unnamed protein product [Triticum turgidum subsp. durum]
MSVDAPVPTLRPEERAGLLALLASAARPLADVVADFLARFPRERRLRVGATLCFLLEDKKMLHATGRLIAFAILHQSYSSQPVNPYVPLLLNAACDESSDKSEQAFVQLLLTSASGDNNNEVLQKSAVDYVNGPVSASQPYCHGNTLRSNSAGVLYSLSLKLVVSEALLLDVLYQIQIYLRVVPIHQRYQRLEANKNLLPMIEILLLLLYSKKNHGEDWVPNGYGRTPQDFIYLMGSYSG